MVFETLVSRGPDFETAVRTQNQRENLSTHSIHESFRLDAPEIQSSSTVTSTSRPDEPVIHLPVLSCVLHH